MKRQIRSIGGKLRTAGLVFSRKPIVIGGMAMEYYGIRKSGPNVDLVVAGADYDALADRFPERRVDLSGDLCVVLGELKLWRSIALLDYGFYAHDAADEGEMMVVSLDRLLFMRVCAMGVAKYMDDLKLMREHYFLKFANKAFRREAESHAASYKKSGGMVLGGQYCDGEAGSAG